MFWQEKVVFSTYEKPTHHDYIPDVYKLRWDQADKFLPDYMIGTFNQRMFNNFLHRECFNSCITKGEKLSSDEQVCYNNCRNKHLYSMGIFKDILMTNRKWKGFRNFINIREYSRTPDEMATNIPTDTIRRQDYLNWKDYHKNFHARHGLLDIFGYKKSSESNIFDYYLEGRFTNDSVTGQEFDQKSRKDRYNEYKELSEKFGEKVQELLKGKKKTWAGIPGEDFVPEEEGVDNNNNTTTTTGEASEE
jgi:hypothetical protein